MTLMLCDLQEVKRTNMDHPAANWFCDQPNSTGLQLQTAN